MAPPGGHSALSNCLYCLMGQPALHLLLGLTNLGNPGRPWWIPSNLSRELIFIRNAHGMGQCVTVSCSVHNLVPHSNMSTVGWISINFCSDIGPLTFPCEAAGFAESILPGSKLSIYVRNGKWCEAISVLGGTAGSYRHGFRCTDSEKRPWKWLILNKQWQLLKMLA